MWRWAAAVLCIAALAGSATAAADPPVPQPGSSCASNLVDAMTWPPDAKAPLLCTGGGWQPVAMPYPTGERWVSYGPAMRLHGDGLRNPVIESGNWAATPLTPDDQCRAEQLAVVPGVGVGPPRIDEGGPGQVLRLQVVPKLFSIDMTGNCLWQKVPR
ncbi:MULTISPECIES: hypothetical protein [unclassified Mycobacterium]|uniref:hypothetical protein n=1 Tax=unclassified Mycobacterium TaxID=2642494 RepID=UPI0029C96815|nr:MULTISPECIES: hypothetical protein [unclassified Mycobacterium]